jgi:leucyl aminopeptidase
MTVKVLDKKEPDCLLIPLSQSDQLQDRLAAIALSAGVASSSLHLDFLAESKEVLLLYASGKTNRKIYLVGLGKKTGLADVTNTLRSFCFRYKAKLPEDLALDLRDFREADIPRLTEAVVSGMLLGLYDIGQYRTEKKAGAVPVFGRPTSMLTILVPAGVVDKSATAAVRGEAYAEIAAKLFDLLNAPGNYKTPEMMADWVEQAGRENGFNVRILSHAQIVAEGLQAIHAVGKGSPYPPVLILMDYDGTQAGAETPLFGLVGKGITFDTGGISIKPSTNMHLMKSDMGGAAAVFGAFMLASRLKLPIRLTGAVPAAENMVDGLAVKPGDVIGSYSGKTIEVIDTDAEGRLVLADALAYVIKNDPPDVLIDLATLTGSIIRALGIHAAGLFTQNDVLADTLSAAGRQTGESLWRMPMWDEYGTDLKSDVADLRNFTGKPMAESISAAKFIEHFTAKHPTWAHLDIAGTAFADSEFAQSKSGTGFGIRLLVEFVELWMQNHPAA